MPNGWVGFDLDSTLAKYYPGQYPRIGEPIQAVVDLYERVRANGYEVRIVTARVDDRLLFLYENTPEGMEDYIQEDQKQRDLVTQWCKEYLGETPRVTNCKDFDMILLIDDRALQVERNTGRILGEVPYHLCKH
jgi:hypothetical protein